MSDNTELDVYERADGSVMASPETVFGPVVANMEGYDVVVESGTELGGWDPTTDTRMKELARQLSSWSAATRRSVPRGQEIMDKFVYTPPENPYDERRSARWALVHDDVVAGVADLTEAISFRTVRWESANPDDADVFNQISKHLKLASVIRAMWREDYACSEVVCSTTWGWYNLTVRGTTAKGNLRKTRKRVWAPKKISVLDSTKIVPIAHSPLTDDRLAWSETAQGMDYYQSVISGERVDRTLSELMIAHYMPNERDQAELGMLGVDTSSLLELNPDRVFRHTATKSDWQRFADNRMRSVFPLLDLKQQLIAADRAMLVGAANYILLIRKGTDALPGKQGEIDHLRANWSYVAKVPTIVSDHRLSVDIIAPKADLTLDSSKYDTLNGAILSRLLGTAALQSPGKGSSAAVTILRSIERAIENRRNQLAETLEYAVAEAIVNHPNNAGVFDQAPSLAYMPRSVNLTEDAGTIAAMLNLRTAREISRETLLDFFNLDESVEAQRVQAGKELYDHVFNSIVPYSGAQPEQPGDGQSADGPGAPTTTVPDAPSGPVKETPAQSGARGGRPVGGGRPSRRTDALPPKGSTGGTGV